MNNNAQVFTTIVNDRRSVRIYSPTAPFDKAAVQRCVELAVLAPNSSNMQVWEFYCVGNANKIKEIAKLCMNQSAARTARELVIIVVRRDKWKQRAQFMYNYHQNKIGDKPKAEYTKREMRYLNYFGKLMPIYYVQDWFGFFGLLKKLFVSISSLWRPVVWQVSKSDLRVVCHKSAALAAQTFMLGMQAEGYATCPMEGVDTIKLKRYLNIPYAAEINMVIGCGPGLPEGIYNERIRVDTKDVIFRLD